MKKAKAEKMEEVEDVMTEVEPEEKEERGPEDILKDIKCGCTVCVRQIFVDSCLH